MSRSRISITVLGALALAACTADRIDPVSPLAVSPSRSVSSVAPTRYIVLAKNSGFESDFATRVAALGGTVESLHKGAGIAVVTSLRASAVSQVGKFSEVSEVQADATSRWTHRSPRQRSTTRASRSTASSQVEPGGRDPLLLAVEHAPDRRRQGVGRRQARQPGVTVAILDTGIDYDEPDLNGLVDLSRSASFVAVATMRSPRRTSRRATRSATTTVTAPTSPRR